MAEFHDLDWTHATLRYLLDLRLQHAAELREADLRFMDERDRRYTELAEERARALEAALAAAEKANELAQANAEKWRENANEWRGAMQDRDRELPSRREVETLFKGIDARVDAVEAHQDRAGGKSEGIALSGGVLAASLGAVVAVMTIVVIAANLLT
jgi:hypothetical protein